MHPRWASFACALAVGVVGSLVVVVPADAVAPSGGGGKVTICHRTHSTTNPYRRITVGNSAVSGNNEKDHTHHIGAPFSPTTVYPPSAKNWGDIIPGSKPLNMTGTTLPSPCEASRPGTETMTAQEFFNVEREAGQSVEAIRIDLADQDADADAGLTFTSMSYTGTDPAIRAADGLPPLPPSGGTGGSTTGGTTGATTTGADTTGGTSGGTTTTGAGTTGTDPTTGGTTGTDPTTGGTTGTDPTTGGTTGTDPTTGGTTGTDPTTGGTTGTDPTTGGTTDPTTGGTTDPTTGGTTDPTTGGTTDPTTGGTTDPTTGGTTDPTTGGTTDPTTGGTSGADPTTGTGGADPTTGTGGADPTTGTGGADPTTGTGGADPTTGTGGADPTTGGTSGADPTTGTGGADPTTGGTSGADPTTGGTSGADPTTGGTTGTDPTTGGSTSGGSTSGGGTTGADTTGGSTTGDGTTGANATGGTTAGTDTTGGDSSGSTSGAQTTGGSTGSDTTGGSTTGADTSGGSTSGADAGTSGATSTTGTSTTGTSTTGAPPAAAPPAETPAPSDVPLGPPAPVDLPHVDATGDGVSGTLSGIVWFDRNGDGAYDGNEWLLPGVPLTLTRSGQQQVASLRMATAAVLPFARTTTTAADGSYSFTGLAAGTYVVTASLHEAGFAYTSDTDGLRDWHVVANVPQGGHGIASFAGLGKGHLLGQVLDTVAKHPVPGARVVCRWAGFDDTFGTPDDVTMTGTANADGRYDWPGVPYGEFSCVGTDTTSGAVSKSAALRVMSAKPVHAVLPLGTRRAPVASRSSSGRTAIPAGDLPRTGWPMGLNLIAAAWLVVLGGMAQRAGRRKVS